MFAAGLMFACADINLLVTVLFECSFGALAVSVVGVVAGADVAAGVVVVAVASGVVVVYVVAGVVGVAGCRYWVLWVHVGWVRRRMWDDRVLQTQWW